MKSYPKALEIFLVTIGLAESTVDRFEIDHNEGTFYVEVVIAKDADGKRTEWATYEAPLEILYHPLTQEQTELWYSQATLAFLEEQRGKIVDGPVEVGFDMIAYQLRMRINALKFQLEQWDKYQ